MAAGGSPAGERTQSEHTARNIESRQARIPGTGALKPTGKNCHVSAREVALNRKHWSLAVLIALAISFSTGCGSTTISPPNSLGGQTSPPTQSLLTVSGQYDLVLTSTSGRGTTTIYTNFAQTGGTFTGAPNALVCPSNNLSQCKGLDFPVTSITPSGTISGKDVTIAISFPATAGADTVTMAGSATGTSLAGTFS